MLVGRGESLPELNTSPRGSSMVLKRLTFIPTPFIIIRLDYTNALLYNITALDAPLAGVPLIVT